MAKQPPQESHLPEHDATKLELVVTINETDNGTALDSQLRREQAEASVELIAAHLSRFEAFPHSLTKKDPANSRAFQKAIAGAGFEPATSGL